MKLSEHVKISSCQTRDIETEIDKDLSAARRSDEFNTEKKEMNQIDLNVVSSSVEDQPNEIGEMSNEALDAAPRSVEMPEVDPIRSNALARVIQQPSPAS